MRRLHLPRWTPHTWIRAGLIAIMLACLPVELSATGWLKSPGFLWSATVLSTLLGLLLSTALPQRPRLAAALMLIGACLFVAQSLGAVLPAARPALGELASAGWWGLRALAAGVVQALRPGAAAPAVASFPALTEWRAAWGRVALYGWNLRAGWPPTLAPHHWDSGQILLGSLLGLLVWGAAGWVGWSAARRENPWGALTAVVGTAALNTYYSAEGWSFLVVVLALGLLWAGDSALCRLQDRWPTNSLYPGLGFDWWLSSGAVMLAATAVMGVSVWVTDPALGQWVDDLLHPAQVAAPGEGEGIAAASAPANAAPFMGVWPREHLLGAGPDLLNAPVMSVQTPGLPQTHLYWRATSYDEYTGQGWIQNSTSSLAPDAAPLWPASITPPPGFALVRQVVRLQGPGRQIYAAGRPVSLNLPAEGTWLDPEALDLIGVRSVVAQSGYEVLSWVPGATPDDLRSASADVSGHG